MVDPLCFKTVGILPVLVQRGPPFPDTTSVAHSFNGLHHAAGQANWLIAIILFWGPSLSFPAGQM